VAIQPFISRITANRIGKRLVQSIDYRHNQLAVFLDAYRAQNALQHVGVADIVNVRSYTTSKELTALLKIASSLPRGAFALEIGSHLGVSACYIVAGLAQVNGHLFCVDTWNNETMPEGERDTFDEFRKNIAPIRNWITVIRKKSSELTKPDLRVPLSLIFIDGNHAYENVKADFLLVSNWLDENGVVAFHDCLSFRGVSRTIGEALATGEWALSGQVNNLCFLRRAKYFVD
jgi:predicted O-methyltransferase YrrM